MAGALTPKQQRVLDFIAAFVVARRYSPSLQEIADGLELRSLATIYKHVDILAKKGMLTWKMGHKRSIRLTGACPTCGQLSVENTAKSA
jgi:repressor LexA